MTNVKHFSILTISALAFCFFIFSAAGSAEARPYKNGHHYQQSRYSTPDGRYANGYCNYYNQDRPARWSKGAPARSGNWKNQRGAYHRSAYKQAAPRNMNNRHYRSYHSNYHR